MIKVTRLQIFVLLYRKFEIYKNAHDTQNIQRLVLLIIFSG